MSLFHDSALVGASGQAGGAGYSISRSLRFNSADSSFLSRTPASAGNRKTWTWAGWVKRSQLGTLQLIFDCRPSLSDSTVLGLDFNANGALEVAQNSLYALQTTQVFRDVSAWYHIVWATDTTQATASNRMKLYVNGAQITDFATTNYPAQNSDLGINQAASHTIGTASGSYYLNGYLADIHFIDGQALDPTSFGEFSAATGVWMPKAFTGSYGTNGFKLDFADNSAATATTLGKDSSGNGNNWTPNNLSVTAGAGNDSLVDVPTNGSEVDTGLGGEVRGNYPTFNPLYYSTTGLSDGNLKSGSAGRRFRSTFSYPTSGNWYCEYTITTSPSNSTSEHIGITAGDPNSSVLSAYASNGQRFNGANWVAFGGAWSINDVIGIAIDAASGIVYYYKNNALQGSVSGLSLGSNASSYYASNTGPTTAVVNFGQRPFAYTAPSGFKALCTANLPAPTIVNPSTVFDTKLYTGNGSTQTISGLGFSPDLVWIKTRSTAGNNNLIDTVRGRKVVWSNLTYAEFSMPGSSDFDTFNSDGFSILPNYGTDINTSGQTYAAWCWDAVSSTVTNTQGSISSQVRANPSAGFSVVTYTGTRTSNGTDTIGHGLGIAPELIIIKRRDGTADWHVKHKSLTSWQYAMYLNTTAAQSIVNTTYGTMSAPTSTVFSTSYTTDQNVNGYTYVAYCFAPVVGYSSFGSYTGNGSSDGPFVYTGFRPRWVMIKASSSVSFGNWVLHDTSRSASNVSDKNLYANLSNAEDSTYLIDCLSNGFKLRSSSFDGTNGSGATYIYAAFAEHPFQYARAR
ncbi:MAG: hypothetical protein EHM17_14540 [Verrucomicrobiaceae bacterium]|nr:MAG: hypothetical protein EHM17_14540 [Verrucomicrobiaceae bacterium]